MPVKYTNKKKLAEIKKRAKHRKRIKIFIAIAAIILVAAVVVVGGYYLINLKTYSTYETTSENQLGGAADNLSIRNYGDGYLQCSNNGAVYFTKDEVIWDNSFDMDNPIIDICGNYAVIADTSQKEAYLYDKSGLVGKISTTHEIIDAEVSENGIIALSTNDSSCNYIELKDSTGNELINVKSVFSSSGYLQDIALSKDGNHLVAAFTYITEGSLLSKVLFYDFSQGETDNMLIAGFSQYTDTVLTDVEFLETDVVCAVGDNALTFYKFSDQPSIISEELSLEWELQTVSFEDNKLLLVAKDPTNENNYRAYVYNSSGSQLASCGFDFAYSHARLSGSNILLYSTSDFQLFSFKGAKRFSGSFSTRITYMFPISGIFPTQFMVATSDNIQFIRLK